MVAKLLIQKMSDLENQSGVAERIVLMIEIQRLLKQYNKELSEAIDRETV